MEWFLQRCSVVTIDLSAIAIQVSYNLTFTICSIINQTLCLFWRPFIAKGSLQLIHQFWILTEVKQGNNIVQSKKDNLTQVKLT